MKRYFLYQLNLFLLAISFFTRLPVTNAVSYSPNKMKRASQYFPLVGWLLALLLILIFNLLMPILGLLPSLCLLMITSLLLTGALHEDGLADCCDGMWGGQSSQRKLAIMKDSRIGTYGTCALFLMLLTKFVLLWELAKHGQLILALLIAYPFSRALAITLVQDMRYVSSTTSTTDSKSEPLAKPFKTAPLVFVLITGAVATLALPVMTFIYLLLACVLLRYWLKHWLNKHIGGYTGDSLGAAQQFQELLIYLVLLANLPTQGLN